MIHDGESLTLALSVTLLRIMIHNDKSINSSILSDIIEKDHI